MKNSILLILLSLSFFAYSSEKRPLYLTKQPSHIETKTKQEKTQTTIKLCDYVSSAHFDTNNNIATKGVSVRLYDQCGDKQTTTSHENRTEDLCFHPNKKIIMSAGHDNTARARNYDGKEILFLKHLAAINSARFDTTGRYIVTAGNDKLVKLWDGETLKTEIPHNNSVRFARFTQNNTSIVSLDVEGQAQQWDPNGNLEASAKTEKTFCNNNTILNTSGDLIAYTTSNNTVKIKNFNKTELTCAHHKKKITSVKFSPIDNTIISSSEDCTATIWDLNGKQVTIMEHPDQVWGAQYNEAGTLIATTCKDQKARIWNVKGKQLMSFAHEKPLESLTFNADGTLLATISWGSLSIWDLKKQ